MKILADILLDASVQFNPKEITDFKLEGTTVRERDLLTRTQQENHPGPDGRFLKWVRFPIRVKAGPYLPRPER